MVAKKVNEDILKEMVDKYLTRQYTCKQLSIEYKLGLTTVCRHLKNSGVEVISGRFSKSEKQEIVEKYLTGDYSCHVLAREYKIDHGSISDLLKANGVSVNQNLSELCRKYTLNEHYFDSISTEEQSYLLGLMYADSYNNEETGSICLALQTEDRYILEWFNLQINSNRPISVDKRSLKNKKWKDSHRLYISSLHMSKKLADLGCHQAKSLTLKFPTESQVPSHLIRHFVRGMLDGDGSVGIYKNKYHKGKNICCSIVSTNSFCYSLQEILKNELGIISYVGLCHQKTGNEITAQIKICSYKQSIKFLDWIYNDSKIFLTRKHNNYKLIHELYEKTKLDRVIITIGNETKELKVWCDEFDVNRKDVYCRIFYYNWSPEEAIKTPIGKRGPNKKQLQRSLST